MKNRLFIYVLFLCSCVIQNAPVAGQTVNVWEPLGPVDFPENLLDNAGGIARTAQVKFHPKDPNTMYAVTSTGGIFKSKDGGKRWLPAGTDNIVYKVSFASVCIDSDNDQIIYAGSGDAQYYHGDKGLFKSTDGGKTWNRLAGLGNRMILEILMSPYNSNELVVATDDGLWKSSDGGNTWKVKKAGGRFTDMKFKGGESSSTIYAATFSQFFKSDDMGETWRTIPLPGPGIEGGGRIGVSKADGNIVYLTFVGSKKADPPTITPVLKSTDAGESFKIVKPAGFPNLNGMSTAYDLNGQDNYNYSFVVDPLDINTLYAGGHGVYKSVDGGVTWVQTSTYDEKLHTDFHQMIFSPHNDKALYNCNDGGIWVTTDGAANWNPLNQGLAGIQIYDAVQSPLRKDIFSIGTQDNGEFWHNGDKWYAVGGGDVSDMFAYSYSSAQSRYNYKGTRKFLPSNADQGLNFPFSLYNKDDNGYNVLMAFTPLATNVAFLSRENLYRTANLTANPPKWEPISFKDDASVLIKALAISPADKNVLYVVTSDNRIYRSDSALSATPGFNQYDAPDKTGGVVRIALIKNDPNVVYLSTGINLFRSGDKGATWDTILDPDHVLSSYNIIGLVHDHHSTDESIYIAKRDSIFYRNNVTKQWESYSLGLPHTTEISKLEIFQGTTPEESVLRAATIGRGVFSAPLKGRALIAREPENPLNAVSGLDYNYYEGEWDNLPNFNSLTPANRAIVSDFDINKTTRDRDDNFGIVFNGYINIPVEGVYNFYLNSDDGSKLYIGDRVVTDYDGLHGADGEVSGAIALKAGKHAISLQYFEREGDNSLDIQIDGPTIEKQPIPDTMLYHVPEEMVCEGAGSISREMWSNLDRTVFVNIPVDNVPSVKDQLTNYFKSSDTGVDHFAQRVRGYICAPYDGRYTFYVTADDKAALYISSDTTALNKKLLISVDRATGLTGWLLNPSQNSGSVTLKAGQKYYIEVLHIDDNGSDYFTVAWTMPNGQFEGPIPAKRLSPYIEPASEVEVNLIVPQEFAGTELLVKADAKTQNASIVKVEFFQDNQKLGEDLSYPYTYGVKVLPGNMYRFSAKATDSRMRFGTSGAKEVNLRDSLREPENPASAVHGLAYKYYEIDEKGNFPDFDNTAPDDSGFVGSLDLAVRKRDDYFSVRFTGYIDIPIDGYYTFSLDAENDATLYIGDIRCVPGGDYRLINGKIGLKAGKHSFSLQYLHKDKGFHLNVFYSGPGVDKQEIPASAFYKDPEGNQPPVVAIKSPASKDGVLSGSSIVVEAKATDVDGTITKVELLVNDKVNASKTTPPYTFDWNNIPAGTYTLKIRATDDRNGITVSPSQQFYVLTAREPDNLAAVAQGLNYKFYQTSKSNSTPDLDSKSSTKTGTINNFTYSQRGNRDDYFAIRTEGYIEVPSDGVYRFYLNSDDESNFYIGTKLVVSNSAGEDEKSGKIGLKAGRHKVKYDYYQETGDRQVQLSYSGPGIEKQDVPDYVLYRAVSTTAPTVTITSPSNFSYYSAPASVSITTKVADSDGSIKKVEFYQGLIRLGESKESPYDFTWENVPAGTYAITVKAYDNSNAVVTSDKVMITVSGRNELPEVSLNVSEEEPYISPSTFTFSAKAKDNDGNIEKVRFYANGIKIGESSTSPYYIQWKEVQAGSFEVIAVAFDNSGDSTVSAPFTVKVFNRGNIQPVITLVSPKLSRPYSPPLSLDFAVEASDADGVVQKVAYYDNDSLIKEVFLAPFSWNMEQVPSGDHSYYAVAYDDDGESSMTEISMVVVKETPPTVNIYIPSRNATFTTPANITISAEATDEEGLVALVEYYANGRYIGQIDTPLGDKYFHYEWQNVPVGTYTLKAIAYDQFGMAAYSDTVTIIVKSRHLPPVVSISYPANNSIYPAPAQITLEATATDDDGVSLVEYYANGRYIGQVYGPSFIYDWINVEEGTYSVKAIAYDIDGIAKESSPITIVVTSSQQSQAASVQPSREGLLPEEELSVSNIIIAPNPSEEAFSVTARKTVLSLNVTNGYGAIVYSYVDLRKGASIQFGETLPAGMYYVVVVYADGTRETYKLIKNR